MTLISIITPSYNQADFLEQTLTSVLEQDYPHVEYLVVDGASADGSVEIIRKYANKLAWWVSEADSGQACAINKGFARAKGEIIAWLNSDDYYLPKTLSTVARLFAEHPETSLLYGDVLSVDATGEPIYVQRFRPYTLADLMSFHIISQPAVFIRRSLLEQVGYLDSEYHFLLDHQLWLRLAQQAPLFYTPQILAAARYHENAKNIAQAAHFGEEAFKIVAWMQTQPALAAPFAQHKNKIIAGAHRLDAFYLVEAGQMRPALAAYGRTFRHHPLSALKSWKRIIYALLSLLGFARLRKIYLKARKKKLAHHA